MGTRHILYLGYCEHLYSKHVSAGVSLTWTFHFHWMCTYLGIGIVILLSSLF